MRGIGRQHVVQKKGKGESSQCGGKGCKTSQFPKAARKITEENQDPPMRVEFCPICSTRPHIPLEEVNALLLFQLFIDDDILARILNSSLSYAEDNKEMKAKHYKLFTKRNRTKEDIMAFIGALILLGIHGVRNHRKAWSCTRAQYLMQVRDLLTCQQFELTGTFLHVLTKKEEERLASDRLRKLRPLFETIKGKCLEFYQPSQHLSVDERIVKSKACCKMIGNFRK